MNDPGIRFANVLVIANPIAGRGRAERNAHELTAGLRDAGARTELHLTHGRGDASGRLEQLAPETDLVVAVGGDGTVGEVLAGLPPEVPLAVLPMGTANVLGHDLRIPREVAGTLAMIRAGRTTQLDVASVNGRLSFLVTGIGIDGQIVREIDVHRKGPVTKWTYLKTVVRTFVKDYTPPRLRVEIDGERVDGEYGWVLVANMVGYGGFMQLSQDRVLDDGSFEVFLFARGTRRALLGYGLRGVCRRLPGGSCTMRLARRVRVESETPVHYEVDGDYGGQTPVDVEVTGVQYTLLIP